MQANYWWGQVHCGPSNQNFGWAMAHPAHAAPHAAVHYGVRPVVPKQQVLAPLVG